MRTVAEKRLLDEGFPVRELEQIHAASLVSKWRYQKAQAIALLWRVSAFEARAIVPNPDSLALHPESGANSASSFVELPECIYCVIELNLRLR